MASDENRGHQALTGIIAVLVATLILAVCAAIYCFRLAEEARVMAEMAQMSAVSSKEREAAARESIAVAEHRRDTQAFFDRYYKHVVGVQPLSEAELAVVRPSILGDEAMAPVLETFEADMASINQLLGPDRQVHNYHDAITACLELLEKESN